MSLIWEASRLKVFFTVVLKAMQNTMIFQSSNHMSQKVCKNYYEVNLKRLRYSTKEE